MCFGLLDLGIRLLHTGLDRVIGPSGPAVALGLLGPVIAAVLTGIYLAATTGRRVGTGRCWHYALFFTLISAGSLLAVFWLPTAPNAGMESVIEAVLLMLLPPGIVVVLFYLLLIWLGFVLGQRLVRVR